MGDLYATIAKAFDQAEPTHGFCTLLPKDARSVSRIRVKPGDLEVELVVVLVIPHRHEYLKMPHRSGIKSL